MDMMAYHAIFLSFTEHKVVFLKGNKPCSGMVGIEQDTKTYWLSGSNWTWNVESANTVCQQMHCGNASNHMHINNTNEGKSIWKDSYSCSSNTKSLFDCQKTQNLSSDHEDTIAYVTCSGSKKLYFFNSYLVFFFYLTSGAVILITERKNNLNKLN